MGCCVLLLCLHHNQYAVNDDSSSMSNVGFSKPSSFIQNGEPVNQKNDDGSFISNFEFSNPSSFIQNGEPVNQKNDDGSFISNVEFSNSSSFIENGKTVNQKNYDSSSVSNVEFSNPSSFIENGEPVNQKNDDSSAMSNVEFSNPSSFIQNGEPMNQKNDDSSSMSNVEFSNPSSFVENGKPVSQKSDDSSSVSNGELSNPLSFIQNGEPMNRKNDDSSFMSNVEFSNHSFIENGKSMNQATDVKCNIFDGKWVYKPTVNVYDESLYPFLSDQVSCKRNGRTDVRHQNWFWEANDCEIPRVLLEPISIQLDTNQANGTRVMSLDTIDASAQRWRGADIIVFNTGHWWSHHGKFRAWDLYQYEGNSVEEMEIEVAFEMAMKTWASWVDQNLNSTETTVAFRSISPEHKGKHWCYNVTEPIMDESYVALFPMPVIEIAERVIGGMTTPVRYLNITKLSQSRRDAHPTVYATKEGKPRPARLADCSHWCLPGVPDTWNRLLYALMVF
ncbi:hypothetical protein F0562_008489 [Nyssa sinensis]|uniref:Trichome birefringence-like C-terminal domain-containing protein n=1 Tax=Nyssa sinensis TaxID=561372 RepID=A0A5J5A8H5_9ASTE|nr:hypothetical protein F0562_008489 [Nyssa sinensis]